MSRLIKEPALTFDDVLIEPAHSDISSREEIDLSSDFLGLRLRLPILSANMDYITEEAMAHAMWQAGGLGVLHRFADLEDEAHNQRIMGRWIDNLAATQTPVIISVGVRHPEQSLAWLSGLEMAKVHAVCIDVAHGHMQKVLDFVAKIRALYPETRIIAGNVATAGGYEALAKAGTDAIKVGVGPGCLAGGTRILMANSTYRNIEDVKVGDSVIDGLGNSQKVLGTKFSGYRQVVSSRHTCFHLPLVSTPDHKALVGDLSGLSKQTRSARGYVSSLTRNKKIRGFPSRIQWQELGNPQEKCLLSPRVVNFDLPQSFSIDLHDYAMRPRYLKRYKTILSNSYDLGYIFGLFMGDGNSRLGVWNNSVRGSVHWSLGPKEIKIADKVSDCLERTLGVRPKVRPKGKSKVLWVSSYSLPLARLMKEFGKRTQKHLPEQYLCADKDYLSGLWDGLIDSDGDVDKTGRIGFTNTSPALIELASVLSKILFGSFPEISIRSDGTEKGSALVPNNGHLNKSYRVRLNTTHEKRLFGGYQAVKLMNQQEIPLLVPTYDLEIENSHTFIANNVIVHNSACTTRVVTGIGVPQLSAILECAERRDKLSEKTAMISDGGIRTSGDIVKALAAGADTVMLGRLLAGANECPDTFMLSMHQSADGTRTIFSGPAPEGMNLEGGKILRPYRGSSTLGANSERSAKEGVSGWVEAQGPVAQILRGLTEGVRSGMSYVGARTLPELRAKTVFRQVLATSLSESGPRL